MTAKLKCTMSNLLIMLSLLSKTLREFKCIVVNLFIKLALKKLFNSS